MIIHVNLPSSEGFNVEGAIPENVIAFLKAEFGSSNVKIEEDLVDPFDTEWFKETSSRLTPGSNLKFYRKQSGMTQQNLAERLGTTKQAVCAMEHDSRPISKRTAKILAGLFSTSPARFI